MADRFHTELAHCGSTTSAAWLCCRTTRHSTPKHTEEARLVYRWHPFAGESLVILKQIRRTDRLSFRCVNPRYRTGQRLDIPAWMFDSDHCQSMQLSDQPSVCPEALRALWDFLQEACLSALTECKIGSHASYSKGDSHGQSDSRLKNAAISSQPPPSHMGESIAGAATPGDGDPGRSHASVPTSPASPQGASS